jgi:CubicO group peptidase (beta-lactamase class C family)
LPQLTVDHQRHPRFGEQITAGEVFAESHVQALLVVRRGVILHESYPGMDPAQRHSWMSVSKLVINCLLGHLQMEGQLDMEASVTHYLPELKHLATVRIQDLADMNVPLSIDEADYQDPNSSFWKWGAAVGWFDPRHYSGDMKSLLREIRLLDESTRERPGVVFYTGASSQILSWIIETVTGAPILTLFTTGIWHHLGAVSPAAACVDDDENIFAGGGYLSTLRDLARFGHIWSRRGVAPDGTRIFADEWVDDVRSGAGCEIISDHRYHNHAYSRGGGLLHQGHSGQMLWVNPDTETVIACFGAIPHPLGQEPWTCRNLALAAEAIDRELG